MVQQRLRRMPGAWMYSIAEEIQGYENCNEMKNFFASIKAVYGPCATEVGQLFSSDGTALLAEKSHILKRWTEHFRIVSNLTSKVSDDVTDRPPQRQQTTTCTFLLPSSEKSKSPDTSPAGRLEDPKRFRLMDRLRAMFQKMWRHGQVLQDFKDAIIVHIYKWKGNRQIRDNPTGISLTKLPERSCRELAPTLFSPVFSPVLLQAYRDERPAISIAYRTDDLLLPTRRVQAPTRTSKTTVQELLFANDRTHNTKTEATVQRSVDLFASGCAIFELSINTDKTVITHRPEPEAARTMPSINVNETRPTSVDTSAYLGSTILNNTKIYAEVAHRISKGSQAFGRRKASVWSRHRVQINTELKMSRVVVSTTLLYGVESWTVYVSQSRKLNHFHISCFQKMLHAADVAGQDPRRGSQN
ncbi:hypothetical protein SprV_0401581000 [Sparganum proliferum]